MLPKDKDLEKIKQLVREEFENLKAEGGLADDLLIESLIEEPVPSYYKIICSFLYKNN